MIVSEIKLYELLKNSIGEKNAETFVYLTNENMEKKFEQWKTDLATKDDMSALRVELKEEISSLRIATKTDVSLLKEEISSLRLTTQGDIAALRTELLRTIYLTSMGQLIAIIASVVSLVMILKK